MKTYRTPGATATEWSPTGNSQEVSRIETYTSEGGNSVAIPVTLRMAGETTKKGVRRVMLKVEGSVPANIVNDPGSIVNTNIVDAKSRVPFSAHLVVQMPQTIAQIEIGAECATGVTAIVLGAVKDLIAIASDESVTTSSDLSVTGLLAHALAGSPSLDIISGVYGESTARS